MSSRQRPPRAPGAIIVLLLFVGIAAGALFGQPTIGALAGLAAGGAAAFAMDRADRRR